MRQGEINKGFDVLRERIPHPVLSKGRCEKLRKIDILHVAISYIRALENILESGEAGINEFANSLYSVVDSSSCSLAAGQLTGEDLSRSRAGSPADLKVKSHEEEGYGSAQLSVSLHASRSVTKKRKEKALLKISQSLKW